MPTAGDSTSSAPTFIPVSKFSDSQVARHVIGTLSHVQHGAQLMAESLSGDAVQIEV